MKTTGMVASFKTMLQSLVIDYYDREVIQPRQAIRTVIAAIISLIIIHFAHWPRKEWILFTTVFLMQTRLGETLGKCLTFVFLTGLLGVLGISISALISDNIFLLLLLFFVTSFIAVYVGVYGIEYGIVAYYINLYFLMGTNLNLAMGINWMVIPNIIIAWLIDILVIIFFWPPNLEKEIQISMRSSLILLKKLFAQTIKCYTDFKHYEYESLQCRSRLVRVFIRVSNDLRFLKRKKPEKLPHYEAIRHAQERIYQLLISFSLYRYRITRAELAMALAHGYESFFNAVMERLDQIILSKGNVPATAAIQETFITCHVDIADLTNVEKKILRSMRALFSEMAEILAQAQKFKFPRET